MAEHDVDLVGISVQQVLHGLGGAVGGVLAGQSVQHGDAGLFAGGLIALTAHVGGVVALLAIDDDGVGALTGLLSGPQAAFLRGIHIGGAHEAGLALDAHVGIDGQDGDAADGAGKRAGSGAGVIGSDDDGIAARADLLLDHGNLLLDLALSAGAHHVDGDTQVSGGGIAAGLHIAPILGGQGLQNHSDLHIAGSGGIAALLGGRLISGGLFLGGISAAAGHQRQGHYQCEEKCKKLFHLTSFLLLNWFPLTFRLMDLNCGSKKILTWCAYTVNVLT